MRIHTPLARCSLALVCLLAFAAPALATTDTLATTEEEIDALGAEMRASLDRPLQMKLDHLVAVRLAEAVRTIRPPAASPVASPDPGVEPGASARPARLSVWVARPEPGRLRCVVSAEAVMDCGFEARPAP